MAADTQTINNLLVHCSQQDLRITRSLSAQFTAASGLGIYAASAVKSGDVLVHAPTSALLTTRSVPLDFLPNAKTREALTVHGLLAAWLALGDENELDKRYKPWMAIMPSWASFRDSMPMFWELQNLLPELTSLQPENGSDRKRLQLSNGHPSKQAAARTSEQQTLTPNPKFALSPAIQGNWTSVTNPSKTPDISSGLCKVQLEKVKSILLILHDHRDHFGFDILSPKSRQKLTRFLYMWSCVNSRCFYYVPHNTPIPKDDNEAMALIPFMDLFNHSAKRQTTHVRYRYDKKGFTATANQHYKAGQELLISYGTHSNDTLWTDYGFTLDDNEQDEINIDDIVLADIPEEHQEILADTGYLAKYTLSTTDISHRLETAAWLLSEALTHSQWQRMIAGLYEPEADGTKSKFERILLLRKRNRKIATWVATAKNECESSIRSLLHLMTTASNDPIELTQYFVPCHDLLDESEDTQENVLEIARKRHGLCLTRWKQIYNLCAGTLRRLEDQSPGAFVTGLNGRKVQNLNMSADDLIRSIGH